MLEAGIRDLPITSRVEGRNGPRLALEALACVRISREMRGQHLDRHLPLQPRVTRPAGPVSPKPVEIFHDQAAHPVRFCSVRGQIS